MNAMSLLIGLLVGVALGALIGCLYARGHLAYQAAAADERAHAADERAVLVERAAQERVALADGKLAEHFQVLAGQALDQSTRRFLEMATGRLEAANAKAAGELDTRRAAVEHMVEPLKETLARVEIQLRETDEARVRSTAALTEQGMIARQRSARPPARTQPLATRHS